MTFEQLKEQGGNVTLPDGRVFTVEKISPAMKTKVEEAYQASIADPLATMREMWSGLTEDQKTFIAREAFAAKRKQQSKSKVIDFAFIDWLKSEAGVMAGVRVMLSKHHPVISDEDVLAVIMALEVGDGDGQAGASAGQLRATEDQGANVALRTNDAG